ncbi:methyltransferase family protein [Calycomorphotria hydatis]|uniref:Isoprenylcysteine carboxyl methyltransferase (ICMT) family protein n=1 Tax=Calycomorphotria hydatis TaxID=2528027 RepID=A0A517T7U6_9PLAN|nr:methyltransferase [Calycomorphotria hydatis]QDT64451.1 hypothetical protein V22_16850 [Calycomorphotria hydatis]
MDELRWGVLLAVFLSYPPGCLFWLAVHPFANWWRRQPVWLYAGYLLATYIGWATLVLLQSEPLFGDDLKFHWLLTTLAVLLLVTGCGIAYLRSRQLGLWTMFGFPEIAKPQPDKQPLFTAGIYSVIRHPRYVEAVLILASAVLFANYVGGYLLLLGCVLLLAIVCPLEERELRNRFGEKYEEYAQQTPRFFPRW